MTSPPTAVPDTRALPPLLVRGEGGRGGEVSTAIESREREVPTRVAQARALRRASTEAEQRAWQFLRNRALHGLRFKRNVPFDRFFLDFYCPALRLCIEIDGGVHDDPDQAAYDWERTRLLEANGVRVVRVKNEDVSEESLREATSPPGDRARPARPLSSYEERGQSGAQGTEGGGEVGGPR